MKCEQVIYVRSAPLLRVTGPKQASGDENKLILFSLKYIYA